MSAFTPEEERKAQVVRDAMAALPPAEGIAVEVGKVPRCIDCGAGGFLICDRCLTLAHGEALAFADKLLKAQKRRAAKLEGEAKKARTVRARQLPAPGDEAGLSALIAETHPAFQASLPGMPAVPPAPPRAKKVEEDSGAEKAAREETVSGTRFCDGCRQGLHYGEKGRPLSEDEKEAGFLCCACMAAKNDPQSCWAQRKGLCTAPSLTGFCACPTVKP